VTWDMSNLVLVHFETVLVSLQDRYMVSTKHTIGSGIILDASDSTHKWKLISIYMKIVLILMEDRYTFSCETYHMLRNCFGRTRWNS
jgi:hypothetical protein